MKIASVTAVIIAAVASALGEARAACPSIVIKVDNDIPGSGYSEIKPENWTDWATDACFKNYRYLTQHQGDGTRKGKAVWTPAITVAGTYEVVTSFRGSTNRGDDVDYFAYGDDGATIHKKVNQQVDGCTYVTLGTVWCTPVGSCRAVLDGDDGQSAAADLTTFTLKTCGDPVDGGTPDAGGGPCGAIASTQGYELCAESATSCAGVFNNSAGCTVYCAAAGMVCTARFGGGSGCSKEPQTPLGCADDNGHASDWCECAFPPEVDAGSQDAGQPIDDVGAPEDAGPPPDDAGPPVDAGEEPPEDAGAIIDAAIGGDAGLDTGPPVKDGGSQPKDGGPGAKDAGTTTDAAVEPFDYGIGCGCSTLMI